MGAFVTVSLFMSAGIFAESNKLTVHCQNKYRAQCSQAEIQKWLEKSGCDLANISGSDNEKNAEGYFSADLTADSTQCYQGVKKENCKNGYSSYNKFGSNVCRKR